MIRTETAYLRQKILVDPVKMNFFVPGYLANRIQAAVVREALHLVQTGAADVDAVDTVISTLDTPPYPERLAANGE